MSSIVTIALLAFLVWSGMKFMDVITDKNNPASATKKVLVAIPPHCRACFTHHTRLYRLSSRMVYDNSSDNKHFLLGRF